MVAGVTAKDGAYIYAQKQSRQPYEAIHTYTEIYRQQKIKAQGKPSQTK
jgi:hypothetical protein